MQTYLCQNLSQILSIHTLERDLYHILDILMALSRLGKAKKVDSITFMADLFQKHKTIKFDIVLFPDTVL